MLGKSGGGSNISFDGEKARCCDGSGIRVVNLKTGQIRTFKVKNRVRVRLDNCAFSPKGNHAVSASGRFIILWDLKTLEVIRTFTGHTAFVTGLSFSPDGKQVLSGSADKTLRLWDVQTGNTIRNFKGHEGNVFIVAFSPDGKQVLSSSVDRTLRLWDVATGRVIHTFKTNDRVSSVAFSPNGSEALSGDYIGTVRLWKLPRFSDEKLP
jgi:WD40 repeat protein